MFLKSKIKIAKINILDTGLNTLTGGRLKRASKYLDKNEDFMFTYGDGISNVNLRKLFKFHKKHGKNYSYCCKATCKVW